MTQEYKFKTTGEMITNFKPSYAITVGNADGEVGRLDFSGPKLIFTGDAEESAKFFLDYLALSWSKRLQEERKAEREACLALVNQGTGEATSSDALKILHMERDRISAAIRARNEQEQPR